MSELNFDELFKEAIAEEQSSTTQDSAEHEFASEESDDATSNTGVATDENTVTDGEKEATDSDTTDTDSRTDANNDNGKSDEVDYKSLYEEEKHRTKSWDGRLKAKDRENETLKAQLAALNKQIESAATSKDDKAITEADESVATFLTEFPELAEPIRKMIDSAVRGTKKELISEVERNVVPLKQTMEETARDRHFNAITSAHDDFESIVTSGKLKEWIDSQPSFIRRAYEDVYNQGTASEVIELMDQFRVANPRIDTGNNASAADSTVAKHKPSPAVRSRPSGVPSTRKRIEKDDFDGAWQMALASE